MYKKNLIPIRYLLFVLPTLLFCACRKEGCKDRNAVNYNANVAINDGLCTYRYLNEVLLQKVTFRKDDTNFWDDPNKDPLVFPDEEYPDLKFYLKRKSSTYWEYQTETEFDAKSLPIRWNIRDSGSSYLLIDTEYEYKLVDEDEKSAEVLLEGTFIPSQVLQGNTLLLQNSIQTIIIELDYIVS